MTQIPACTSANQCQINERHASGRNAGASARFARKKFPIGNGAVNRDLDVDVRGSLIGMKYWVEWDGKQR